MLICFLRHGETLWNREKRIQGTTPHTDLTDFGVRLAEWTRDGLAARGIRFDRAYTSPLRRAAHTAEIILRGQGCPLVADARLREMAFGPYEGTTMGDGRWEDENIRAMFQDPENYRAPDGAETFEAVAARLSDFLENELAPLEGTCRTVLAVSHGGLMRTSEFSRRHPSPPIGKAASPTAAHTSCRLKKANSPSSGSRSSSTTRPRPRRARFGQASG